MPRRLVLATFLLFLLLVLVIPLPSAHALPSIVSTSRVSGGAGLCGGASPACTFTPPYPTIDDQPPVSFSLAILGKDGSSAEADDPWHSNNAPSSGLNFGNSEYQFVIQEDSGRQPYVVVGGGDSITWSWSSSTSQITLTATTIRAHFSDPADDYSGLGFSVLDQLFSSDIGGANIDDFRGITIETNAESFTFGIVSPTIWTLTATGRTGTTGFWRACIPQSVLDAVGASASDIKLKQNNVDVGFSPTLTTGKVILDGIDKPCYLINLPSISFSTQTFETDMTPAASTKQVETVDMSESIGSDSFAGVIAGAWGSSVDAVKQRINEGVAVANQMYPSTVGQPVGVLASGGNIMPGHGGYLQVIFGGTANIVVLLGYGVDGRVTAMQMRSVIARGSESSSSAAPSGTTPPTSQTSGTYSSAPPRKPAMLMIQFSMQSGVTTIPVYPVKSGNPTASLVSPLQLPKPATFSTQSSSLPAAQPADPPARSSPLSAPTIAIGVLICLVVLSYFYPERAGKRAKPPSE